MAPSVVARRPRLVAALSGRARELCAVTGAGFLLAIVMNWPLAAHLGRDIPKNLKDPLLETWQVAWGGHALLHQPLRFFQANAGWPLPDSLATTDALAGYAPAGLIGSGPHAALVRYDLLFLFAYALAFIGVYLLARELGLRPLAAAVAGVVFAYSPWRLDQNDHLQILSSGGIPLSLFLLLHGYRWRRPGIVICGWLAAAWQLSLGWYMGLQLAYLLLVLAAIAAAVWWVRKRPRLVRSLIWPSVVGIAVFAATAALLARPYLRIADAYGTRGASEVANYSPPASAFLVAPPESFVWGRFAERLVPDTPAQLFPGAVALALAALGLGAGAYSKRLRIGLAVGVAICAVLSLGFSVLDGKLSYRLLYDYAPGWNGLRVPPRIHTLTTLGIALLAAAGAQRVLRSDRTSSRRGIVVLALIGVILLEGSGLRVNAPGAGLIAGPAQAVVPKEPPGLHGIVGPRHYLPEGFAEVFLYWSTDGFQPLTTGGGGPVDPKPLARLRGEMERFPDRRTVDLLRSFGIRWVILDPQFVRGTPWETTAARPTGGLPIKREVTGGVVRYRIEPLPSSLNCREVARLNPARACPFPRPGRRN